MTLVLDASLALAWLLPGEDRAEEADVIIEKVVAEGAFAPALWWSDMGNGLLVALRRNRIDDDDLAEALQRLAMLPVVLDTESVGRGWTEALSLARWHGLTLYDAIYLDLAKRRGMPLASFDRSLRRCAADDGVPVIP